mgnify:FL=1
MNLPDQQYFAWLYSKIDNFKVPNITYFKLAQQLYEKEFVWFIPNDDNRNAEGMELRRVFLKETGSAFPSRQWMEMSSSMLELLIGISYRLSFIDDRPPHIWFWELIDNIDLTYAKDDIYDRDVEVDVDETLDRIIWRLYDPDGSGGLFPLHHAFEDQRNIELWYQMSAYLNEKMDEEWHF